MVGKSKSSNERSSVQIRYPPNFFYLVFIVKIAKKSHKVTQIFLHTNQHKFTAENHINLSNRLSTQNLCGLSHKNIKGVVYMKYLFLERNLRTKTRISFIKLYRKK
jgi:hypothetical protein